jgi:hypothetical protein
MNFIENIVKILLILCFLSSIVSVIICRDITNYLLILLSFFSFICLLNSRKNFLIPKGLLLILACSFLYFSLATINQVSISYALTICLYSLSISTLAIIRNQIGLDWIVNRAFLIILIFILAEYSILLLGGSELLLNNLSCVNPAVSNYRNLHNITSSIAGISHVGGLNSIFLGAQSASLFLVISFFWFLRKGRENHHKIDYILSTLSVILLILSPTITGTMLFIIGCFLYIIIFNAGTKISLREIILLLVIFIFASFYIYFYIDIQHNFSFFMEDIVIQNINLISALELKQIIMGLGSSYTNILITNEISLLALLLMYGIVGFTIFLFLFLFLPLEIGIKLSSPDRVYILIILLLFISLMHYNASIRGGFLFFYLSILSIIFGKFVDRVDT